MDINAFNAQKVYGAAQKALSGVTPRGVAADDQPSGFKPMEAAKEVAATVARSEAAASAFMTGKADPHTVVEAMASAELAVETAVTLRNRVVEAYQELLRMPV